METEEKTAWDPRIVEAFSEFLKQRQWLGPEVSQLWDDALSFMEQARKMRSGPRIERLWRAAVFTAAAGFEAWTNFLANKLVNSSFSLTEMEKDVLQEKKKQLENGVLKPKAQPYKSRERFLLLYRLLSRGEGFGEPMLKNLDNAFKLRDELVHPKPGYQLSLSQDDRGQRVIHGFLWAEVLLAEASRKVFEELQAANKMAPEPRASIGSS